jgi:predicted transcriptional regulator
MHPLRLRLLELIEASAVPVSPNELARQVGEKLNNVSYHVRQLRDARLIVLADTKARRGALQHFYRAAGSSEEGAG